uniref:Uncharacterized protein n=1 Tax=Rhizophora mucronata TaxID=61149 RepID=A0A2P2JGT3_RHIMU
MRVILQVGSPRLKNIFASIVRQNSLKLKLLLFN